MNWPPYEFQEAGKIRVGDRIIRENGGEVVTVSDCFKTPEWESQIPDAVTLIVELPNGSIKTIIRGFTYGIRLVIENDPCIVP